ncbi:MFS transporter [Thermosipho atlanticus]|uniref:Predicted arabinose efflux permease, MFS family n=1 Tax=Thermosipho atlanticus DSM 15807 TaxID=1123380 RepID=A0A1M5RPF2_9BACT|nr:MFS transporter [Thermosipho atlanticus]SHH28122.1 Predicted arabinose efflux permease, MFS family [Thermosipho atlanticus DSM 15807]
MGRWWVVVFLSILLIFLNADQMVMAPNIGAIEEEFGITDAHIGLVASTFTILGAVISLVWGFLADKYNRKKIFIYSVLIGEIPCFMSAFSRSFGELFLWRTLTGIGVGASFPIAYSFVSDMFGKGERGKVSSILGLSISIGGIFGMVIGGFFGATYGWRIPFILVSLPNILLAFLGFLILKEPQRGAMESGIGELVKMGYEYPKEIKLSDYLNLFRIKTNLFLFLQGIAGTIPWGAIPYFMVEFFKREMGFSASQATTIFLIFGAGNIVGMLVGGWLGQAIYNRSPKFVPIAAGFTTILGAILTILVFSKNIIGGSFILVSSIGFVAAMFDSYTGPSVKMMLMNVNEPRSRGRIFSVFNLTDSLGTGIGKLFGGLISTSLGSLAISMKISSAFWFICGIFLFILAMFFEKDIALLDEKMEEMKKKIVNEKL